MWVSHAENLDQSINQPGNNLMHSKESYPQTKKCAFILLCQRLRLAGTNSIIDPNLMCTGLLACQMWGASLRPSQSKPTSEVALRMSWKERVYYVMMKLNMTLALLKIQALYLHCKCFVCCFYSHMSANQIHKQH
mgnify:CR=1 FL=1